MAKNGDNCVTKPADEGPFLGLVAVGFFIGKIVAGNWFLPKLDLAFRLGKAWAIYPCAGGNCVYTVGQTCTFHERKNHSRR
jgi:hypothetical protein